MLSKLSWLIFALAASIVVVLHLGFVQTNIINQSSTSARNRLFQDDLHKIKAHPYEHPSDNGHISQRRFIILTNGNEIKLYPLEPINNNHDTRSDIQNSAVKPSKQNRQQDFINNYFLVKPLDIDLDHYITVDNAFYRWQFAKDVDRSMKILRAIIYKQDKKSTSILPDQTAEDQENYVESAKLGWKKPLITDVDYFFSDDFCHKTSTGQEKQNSKCLVIVWLDKNNKYVRYGSIDVGKIPDFTKITTTQNNNSTSKLSSANNKKKIIWIEEFPPYDICYHIAKHTFGRTTRECQVYGMVVDKKRGVLHVAANNAVNTSYPNRLLSGKISAYKRDRFAHSYEFMDRKVLSFNDRCAQKDIANSTLENLNVDEENGDWLFYLHKQQSASKIFALNTYEKWDEVLKEETKSFDETASIQVVVQSLDTNDAISMSLDMEHKQIYWLTDKNELFSCNISGNNRKLVGRLSPKPAIRSPYAMQVSHDTLYLSDTVKRTIIAYPLKNNHVRQNSNSNSQTKTKFTIEPNKLLQPTHQVLLVETPALYGFRLINSEIPNSINKHFHDAFGTEKDSDVTDLLRTRMRKKYDVLIEKMKSTTSLNSVKQYLTKKLFCYATVGNRDDEYDQILDRSSSLDLFCAYNQLNQQNQSFFREASQSESVTASDIHILFLAPLIVWLILFQWFLIRWFRKNSETVNKLSAKEQFMYDDSKSPDHVAFNMKC